MIAEVTLNSAVLGVATAQVYYATSENHKRAVHKELRDQNGLNGVVIQTDGIHRHRPCFSGYQNRGPTSS